MEKRKQLNIRIPETTRERLRAMYHVEQAAGVIPGVRDMSFSAFIGYVLLRASAHYAEIERGRD